MMTLMCFCHCYVVTRNLASVTYSYFFRGANFLAVPHQSVVVNGSYIFADYESISPLLFVLEN